MGEWLFVFRLSLALHFSGGSKIFLLSVSLPSHSTVSDKSVSISIVPNSISCVLQVFSSELTNPLFLFQKLLDAERRYFLRKIEQNFQPL